MAVSIPEIKKAAARIADFFGVSYDDALKIMPYYKADGAIIRSIIAGDFSTVPGAAAAVGVVLGDNNKSGSASPEMIPGASVSADGVHTSNSTVKKSSTKRSRSAASDRVTASKDHTTIKHTDDIVGGSAGLPECVNNSDVIKDHTDVIKSAGGDVSAQNDFICINDGSINNNAVVGLSDGLQDIPTIDGDILPADDLPPGFSETVAGWLEDFKQKYNFDDLSKIAGLQWRALCLYVGERIKASKILYDTERLRTHGGSIIYKPEKVAALLPIWEALTALYKHIPLASDFVAFAGVSSSWFYDNNGNSALTSGRVQIAKKARDIEERALAASLCDSRENPTGRIYYTKARLGWQETTTIQHISAAAAPAVAALPILGDNGAFLSDNVV